MVPRGFAFLALAALLVVPGCVTPGADVQSNDVTGEVGALMTQAQALTHKAGLNASGVVAAGLVPASFYIGHDAGEPTLGVTSDGTIFFAASTFDNINTPAASLPRTDILRSRDGGATWEDVTPYLPGGVVRAHPETGDPMVYVDTATDRVFDIDQRILVGCYTVISSDDGGESWGPSTPACLYPPADHQTIVAAKPRLLPTVGYPNVVYVCYNSIATTTCGRSLNGGLSFVTTGPVGTRGIYPENAPEFAETLCSALVGHLAAAPDGTVYLPRRECSKPMVAITRDDGTTWELVQVSDVPAFNGGGTIGMDPAVTVDEGGGVHYVFQGADGLLYLTSSADAGATWTPAQVVTAPGLTVGHLATVSGGGNGSLALAYVGTAIEGGYEADDEAMSNATWDAYLALITDAFGANPAVTTVRVNDPTDPIVRGPCGPGRCNNPGLTDFIDVVVDADGRPWVALVDNCQDKCATPEGKAEDSVGKEGFVATLAEGPSLRTGLPLPPIHGALEHAEAEKRLLG